MQQDNLESL